MTTRKTRRISYAQRARQQRARFYTLITVIAILFTCSVATLADDGSHQVTVIADSGDTLWSICEEYKPEDMDLRLFIDKVKYTNRIKSSALTIGQEIVIPLD